MLFKSSACLTAALSVVSAFSIPSFEDFAIDSGLALSGLNSVALLKSYANFQGTCNPLNLKIRQEWRTLSKSKRREYIAAVKCVQAKPSNFGGSIPGAKSEFDDFVWIHLAQTMNIHLTGTFLTWHRYYIHVYEQKLQACGYNGNLPYWEWGLDVNSLKDSPVFDGSDTSMGSDGDYIVHEGLQLTLPGETAPLILPPGTGGGCVTKGPFKDMKLHLGPVIMPVYGSPNTTGALDPSADNERCLKRDLNSYILKTYSSFRNTTKLITETTTMETFQGVLQGDGRYTDTVSLGVHGGGHFSMGGDPGGDAFISPNDPAFYLHHAQVDRLFWMWQMQDYNNRKNVAGNNFFFDLAPSAAVTVEDYINIAPLTSTQYKIKDLMNTVGGPFCYVYI
ncbi:hypothetical protein B0H63DRAFT_183755 [Podospora didyma]|uniref:Tyrosinase copper-binding domain-containing protein n=1 Tax=Podospora didyma TaxID=330526 RepID=A0AAE0TZQ4_9PEZI|nr:hypothetical protein B0H63DRAFT_183755 [Podospora didyma]